ncbi:MAG: transketolase [Anaeroplasma sp.]|uniref:transketolase n=1 Tax=Anaeroplasma sp. TaxID=1872523 RepID=UPI002A91A93C|nr:transketolase [Anaeroplasma sp.]MDY5982670.1 transketolase [Anaeroplasma sp.]
MKAIDTRCVNALRVFGAEMITKAKSGHPGIVLGAAPIIHTLYTRHIRVNAEDEKWFNRDRFVLSAGHGSTLLYMMLHLSGFKVSLDDLKNFRQKGSLTPGHPEYGHTSGVEITTGPLGQGVATSVGLAIAENYIAAKFNKPNLDIMNHYTYVLCGDGDLQEGVAYEAMSLAGHLGLGKLIVLYDSNDIQLDGEVSLAMSDDTEKKFEALGWQYLKVSDGNDVDLIDDAIKEAKKNIGKPTIIEIKTTIGFGAPNSGESSIHGKPMSKEDITVLRNNLEYDEPELEFPDDVKAFYAQNVKERGYQADSDWNELLSVYSQDYTKDYADFLNFMDETFEIENIDSIPTWNPGTKESTRKVMGKVIDWLSSELPNIVGGSADLCSSTMVKGADGNYGTQNPLGRNIRYGVREHAMAAITNGITLHGGLRGYCSGFFVFSDYLKPAVRLAALMHLPSLFCFSHDSVCVGEDGPTHQPIEQLTMFRSTPNVNTVRPADAKEMTSALIQAFGKNTYPTVITSSRQAVLNLEETSAEEAKKGAYIVYTPSKPAKNVIISCGTELAACIDAAKALEEKKVYATVVSMPSQFLFDQQSEEYKETILPKNLRKVAVEMGATMSWYKYADIVKGIDTFGASMPIDEIYATYGFRVEDLFDYFKSVLK